MGTVRILLERGADPNLVPLGGGDTALDTARKAGCQEIVCLLETYSSFGDENGSAKPNWNDIDLIAQNGKVDELAACLSQPGI